MIQQKVSLFQCLTSVPSKAVALDEVVRLIRHDSSVASKTEGYRTMAAVLGKEKADEEVKRKLMPAVSVGVLFDGNGRGAANVLGFTGLALCDIDHIGSDDAVEAAFAKAAHDAHTLMAYRTVSGRGLRVVYRYVRVQDEAQANPSPETPHAALTWPAAFLKGNAYYAKLVGHDYDTQCGDYSRLCGLAHDASVYVNWEAEPFSVSDDEVLACSFADEKERGKARREYAAGTHRVTAEEAWPRVEQALTRRRMVYQSGHHHDYVMHAAFLMNRYGVDRDELLEWAAREWADYDTRQREATIRSCYKRTQQHGTWRLNRQGRQAKETSMITLPEIHQWLTQHVEVVYNLVTDQTMYRLKTPVQPHAPQEAAEAQWTMLDERVLCSMRSQMATDTGKRVLKQDVRDVLNSDFSRLSHPVREYIEALPQWDGTDRVKELCTYVRSKSLSTACEQFARRQGADSYFEWTLHKWLVAMVATWMSDLSSNHTIFVLIGSQGIYKTTFFRHLLPPPLRTYFWENAHNSFATKDDHLALAENCLVEIEEIDLQSASDVSELKALATSQKVKERRPYARFREEKHRLASFCGSGNQEHFLSDETGSRRWLCHKVTSISDPRTWTLHYDQLYAQLYQELRQGFRYWFDTDEQRSVDTQNESFRIESDEEQLIRSRLRPPRVGEKITLMNATMICQLLNGGNVGRGLSSRKVSILMGKLGYKKMHSRQGNFFEVFLIPADKIQAMLAQTEPEEHETDTLQEGDLPF
ncbi:MAG: hypothetical protein IJV38_04650 [Prevotella sp.]|nr:hypothetical protein [Prevotella sp.]